MSGYRPYRSGLSITPAMPAPSSPPPIAATRVRPPTTHLCIVAFAHLACVDVAHTLPARRLPAAPLIATTTLACSFSSKST
ncbi:hypothetical protein ACLOJK_027203, partial [Asimina triloba]